MSGEILVARDAEVVTLTISHPARRNALTLAMYDALERECAAVSGDPTVRALVLKGAAGAFAGGSDIRHVADIRTGEDGVDYEARMARVQQGLLAVQVPVIAVVDGPCVGGGLVLAALSDIVLCTPGSRFGAPIALTLGNILSPTSIARLQQCFGRRATSEMLLTGRLLSASEAADAGFVTAVVEEAEIDARLTSTLDAIRRCAPLTLRSFKEFERRIDAQLANVQTADVYREVYGSADFREGVEAFLSRRPARFEGA